MKANINTVLIGEKVVLVPYRPEHVPVSVCLIREFFVLISKKEISRMDA
jgi:hypothetical protein